MFGSTTIFVLSAHIPFAATMPAEQVSFFPNSGAMVIANVIDSVLAD